MRTQTGHKDRPIRRGGRRPRGSQVANAPPQLITEGVVLDWVATLQRKSIETARGVEGAPFPEFLQTLLTSAEMLLRPDFRADYNNEIRRSPLLANGLQPTAEMGGMLLRKWHVGEILLPAHGTLATFPVPTFAPGGDSGPLSRTGHTIALRSRLDWAALRWHSVYLMMCTHCHTPQGPRNKIATPIANVPSIGKQIENILGPTRTIPTPQPRGLSKQSGLVVQDEVWGGLMPNIGPGDFGRRRPDPLDISLGWIFDAVTGISGHLPAMPPGIREQLMDTHVSRLRPVAEVLKRIKCVRCGRIGTIRYLPRLVMPIDLDLSPEANSERARRRTSTLQCARAYVANYPALLAVFWIPPMYDPGEFLEASKGLFDLLDTRGRRPADDLARYWRVAIWAQMAVRRRKTGRTGGYWESLPPQIKATSVVSPTTNWAAVEAKLRGLPQCVASLRHSDQAVERAVAMLDTLMSPPYREVRETLRRYCETQIYPAAHKHRRRSQPVR